MITSVHIENYRSLRDVTLELGPLTVLVGKNGSGKSNVVGALNLLSWAMRQELRSVIDADGPFLYFAWHHRDTVAQRILLQVNGQSEVGGWRYELGIALDWESGDRDWRVFREALWTGPGEEPEAAFHIEEGAWVTEPEGLTPAISTTGLLLPLLGDRPPYGDVFRPLRDVSVYAIRPPAVQDVPLGNSPARLAGDGANLAQALMGLEHNGLAHDEIEHDLEQILGYRLRYKVEAAGDRLWLTAARGEEGLQPIWLPLATEAEGAIAALAILAALRQQPTPLLVAIEEPEAALHPGAMAALAAVLEVASERTQVLVTTHSPDLIACLDPAVLRVVEWEDGQTKIGPLARGQMKTVRERLFSSGDLVRIDGGLRREQGEG